MGNKRPTLMSAKVLLIHRPPLLEMVWVRMTRVQAPIAMPVTAPRGGDFVEVGSYVPECGKRLDCEGYRISR